MLEPNPNKRINAKEALKHKYFDELRGSNWWFKQILFIQF